MYCLFKENNECFSSSLDCGENDMKSLLWIFFVGGDLKAICNPKKMIFYCLTSAIMSKISY